MIFSIHAKHGPNWTLLYLLPSQTKQGWVLILEEVQDFELCGPQCFLQISNSSQCHIFLNMHL